MTAYKRRLGEHGQPLVHQHVINGWLVSYNPDDSRYHVAVDEPYAGSAAMFTEYRNAVQWAKKHIVTQERRTAAGLV
jgi:hypothetical protein